MTWQRRAKIRRALYAWRCQPDHGCSFTAAPLLGLERDELRAAESRIHRPSDELLERVAVGLSVWTRCRPYRNSWLVTPPPPAWYAPPGEA